MQFYGMTRRGFVRMMGSVGLGAAVGAKAGCDECEDRPAQAVPQAYRYDISHLAADDGGLPRLQRVRSIDTELAGAWALAGEPGGHLAVGCARELAILDAEGQALRRWTLDQPGSALAWDETGRLWVAQAEQVQCYSRRGELREVQPIAEDTGYVTAIAVSGDDLFVADADTRTVSRYHGGRRVWRIDGFHIPSRHFHLALGSDKLLWVAHTGRHRIEAYDFTGELVRSWGEPGMSVHGFSGCCNPSHFAILADGRFVSSEKGLHRAKLHDTQGQVQAMVIDATTLAVDVNAPVPPAASLGVPRGPLVAAMDTATVAVLHPHNGGLHMMQLPGEGP